MALIGKSIPNLINGVSEQPAEVRLPSQCEAQNNFLSSVVEGLKRRHGTQHVARIIEENIAGAFVHVYNRDQYEKYIIVAVNGNLRVFDVDGNERAVNAPSGFDYLLSADPSRSLKAVTVADYTFILNKERVARAVDPMDGLVMTPVRQRYQRLDFTTLDDSFNAKGWFYRVLDHDAPNGWRTILVKSNYDFTIAGVRFTGEPGSAYTAQSLLSTVASQLSKKLGRQIITEGETLRIPLNDGEAGWAVSDSSTRGQVQAHTPSPTTDWVQMQMARTNQSNSLHWVKRTTGDVLTSRVVDEVTGYTSEAGDAIPAARLSNKQGLIFIRQGDYGSTYNIHVNGVTVASLTTGKDDRNAIGTTVIASNLYSQLASKLPANISAQLVGNVIVFAAKDTSTDFTLSVSDSGGDTYMRACKGRVQDLSDLPQTAIEGFTIKVSGQAGYEADDYYVQYTEQTNTGEKTSGSWTEVCRQGLFSRPAPETMPHRLVSEADGTFTFEPCDWDARTAGDEDSAPEPSFINKKINDVFFYKNRLGFLADENIILSEAGSYYMFYPSTVIQFLDTHPIDVAVTNDSISILHHAVPFNEALLLFSDRTQFIIAPDEKLTAETISVDVTTRFEATMGAKPVASGKNVFFPALRGRSAAVREYFVDPDANVNDAADVTSHCPAYVEGEIRAMASSPNEETVACLTYGRPDSVYIYKYYWQGNEKVQSSWSRWDFGARVLAASFIDSSLYMIVQRPEGVCIEVIDVTDDTVAPAEGFQTSIHLDRFTVVPVGEALPWQHPDMVAVDQKGNKFNYERVEQFEGVNGFSTAIAIGMPYKSLYEFSKCVLLEGDSRIAPLMGKLQLRTMTIKYVKTGYFRVCVESREAGLRTFEFNARRIGAPSNILGRVPIDEGTFEIPVWGNNEDVRIWIETDSHLPATFLSAEWEAVYHRSSRRV